MRKKKPSIIVICGMILFFALQINRMLNPDTTYSPGRPIEITSTPANACWTKFFPTTIGTSWDYEVHEIL